MSAQQCLDIIREAGGDLTDNEIEQLLDELQRRKDLNMASQKFIDAEEAALAAAQQMGKDMKLAAAIAKREAADNEVKFLKAVSILDSQWSGAEGASKGEGIAALIYSSNKVRDSGRRSVMGYQTGTQAKLMGAFMSDLLAVGKGADEMLSSGTFDGELYRAIYDIRQGKTPTGSEMVPELAQVIVKHQEYWRNLKNENGAWIGKLDDYITSRSHNPTLIRNAGFDAWKAEIEQHLDWGRTLQSMPDKNKDEFLANVYKGLAYGHHLKSGDDKGGFQGAANLAKKLSQERVLHFKGPEAEFAYAQKFASGGMGYQMAMALEHTAQSVGLMKVLGANPGSMIERLMKHVNESTPMGVTPVERHQIEVALKSVDGTMRAPVNDVMARVTTYSLAVQSLSKLGGALLSQFGDIAPRMMEFKRQGMNPMEAVSTQVEGFVGGLGGEARREALLDIAGLTDSLTAEMARANAVDPIGGTLSKMNDVFFRITGQHRWQLGAEGSAAVMIAKNLARQTDKEFAGLHGDLQVLLRQHGIGEAEWKAIRQGSQKALDDASYLSPQSPKDLPNEAIQHLVQNDIDALHERTKDAINSLNEKISKEAAWQGGRQTKLQEYSAKLGEALNRFMGTRDAKLAERADYVEATREMAQARLDRAAAEADIASYLAAEKQQDVVKGFLDRMAGGKDLGRARAVGERLGKEIGKKQQIIAQKETALRKQTGAFEREILAKYDDLDARLNEKASNMSARGNVEARITKLAEMEQRWAEQLNSFMGTRERLTAEQQAFVDDLKATVGYKFEVSRAEADKAISDLELARKERSAKMSDRVDRNVQKNIRESGSRGQALGEKIGRAERRMVELEKSLRDMERTFDAETKAKFEELTKRLDARSKEMDEFMTASVERQARYADLANQWESSVTRKEQRIYDKMREELSDRMHNFYSDRVGFAAIKPDAKTRAMLLQGTQPGTWLGSGLRLVTQFKSFPIAFLQKAMGSALYTSGSDTLGQAVRNPKAMGEVATLVLTSTVLGYMSMVAKDLVKGREPRDPTDPRTMMAALQQGGGMGIYGDFLFGEAKSRTGGTLVSNLAGPTLSTADDLTDIWRRIRNGDDAAAKTFNTVLSNTPFMNVFYLRPVLDYAILHSLTEAMNPGALRRREALVTKENEQGWLRRPSENFADPLGLTR